MLKPKDRTGATPLHGVRESGDRSVSSLPGINWVLKGTFSWKQAGETVPVRTQSLPRYHPTQNRSLVGRLSRHGFGWLPYLPRHVDDNEPHSGGPEESSLSPELALVQSHSLNQPKNPRSERRSAKVVGAGGELAIKLHGEFYQVSTHQVDKWCHLKFSSKPRAL